MQTTEVLPRFWKNVDRDGPNGCWLWTGHLKPNGYGSFDMGKDGRRYRGHAHRFAYELMVGIIGPGLTVDHLCKTRHCVNTAHMELVTAEENVRRGDSANAKKTHCKNGHEFTPENTYTYWKKNGKIHRNCRTCHRLRSRVIGPIPPHYSRKPNA